VGCLAGRGLGRAAWGWPGLGLACGWPGRAAPVACLGLSAAGLGLSWRGWGCGLLGVAGAKGSWGGSEGISAQILEPPT
jgi:hypothetical protein